MADTAMQLRQETAAHAERRLLLKLWRHNLHEPAMVYEAAPPEEDRWLTLVLALAPMTMAFLYLMVLSCFLFL